VILLVNGCYQTFNIVGGALRFRGPFLLLTAPKHLFDFISRYKAGLVTVKHVEDLAKSVLIHDLGRV
jgi:hypothetical protein